jgi:hypothetical protein
LEVFKVVIRDYTGAGGPKQTNSAGKPKRRPLREVLEEWRREEQARKEQQRLRREQARRERPPKPRAPRRKLPTDWKPAGFYVPRKLDLGSLPAEWRWYAAYFLSLIHWKRICYRGDRRTDYVNLKQHYLRKVIPRKYWRAIWKHLVEDTGIVECDMVCEQGRKCLGYRIAEAYRDTHKVCCPVDEVNRKVAALYADERRDWLPVHHWLAGKFGTLGIDLGQALEEIKTLKPRKHKKGERGMTVREYRKSLADQVNCIADGQHYLEPDKFGRVHTPLTNMRTQLRECLRVNGGKLVEIDLANSQPLFLGLLVLDWLGGTSKHRERLRCMRFGAVVSPKTYGHFQSPGEVEVDLDGLSKPSMCVHTQPSNTTTTTPPQPHFLLQGLAFRNPVVSKGLAETSSRGLGKVGNCPPDLVAYLQNCLDGTFYESLMTTEDEGKGERHRKRFKRRFFRVLFGQNHARKHPNRPHFPNLLKQRFRTMYLTVANVLHELKRKDYRHSSHLLQNYEATLFIHKICGRIMREMPDLPLYTIHDSLLTIPAAVGDIRGIIHAEFAKLGVVPKLNVKGETT